MTTSQDPTDLPAVAARLIDTIDELTKSINELLHRTARSEEEIARSKKQTRWQWAAILAVAVLFAIQGFTTYQQVQTSRATIQNSQALASVQGDVLCPVWAVFLGGFNPSTRAPGPDRATYEATYAVIRDGYNRLGCTTPFVPPPTTRVTPPK
jgi:hypothetical protein